MKKLKSKIATLVIALCSVVCCMFMLTACGDSHTHSYANNWTYDETHHWKEATCGHSAEKANYAEHSLNNNECECGYTTVTYTVADAAAWNKVMTGDYLNIGTINVDAKIYTNDGNLIPEESITQIMKSTSDSMYMFMTQNQVETIQYLVKQDGTWYGLRKEGTVWYGTEQDSAKVEKYTFAGSQGINYVDRFNDFTYDEENHCYVAKNYAVEGSSADYVKIYIENGKIIKTEIKGDINGTSYMIQQSVFSNFGTTTIDVPEWTLVA